MPAILGTTRAVLSATWRSAMPASHRRAPTSPGAVQRGRIRAPTPLSPPAEGCPATGRGEFPRAPIVLEQLEQQMSPGSIIDSRAEGKAGTVERRRQQKRII